MTPTQEPPSGPPLLCQEHSIHTADSAEIDRFVTEVYVMMEPALKTQGFINPKFRINLALHEAVVNAWRHGNQKDPNLAVTVRWRINEDLVLEVLNEGEGFDFQSITDPRACENISRSCGRGIAIIAYLADQVSLHDRGRHLVASFGRVSAQDKKAATPT
ncbi:MAG: ATP-binding protein [Desulfurivibrionaceae bacterium]|jgi:serine/threonine-protein kinase RsbW